MSRLSVVSVSAWAPLWPATLCSVLLACEEPVPPRPVAPPVEAPDPRPAPVEVEAPPPAPPEPPPAPPEAADPAITGQHGGFPIWDRAALPADRSTPLPTGQELVDVAVHPTGSWALVVTQDTDRDNVQWHRWDFEGPLAAMPGPPLDDGVVREVAWDPRDGAWIVSAQLGASHVLLRCAPTQRETCEPLLTADAPFTDVRVPLLKWGGQSRVFATLEEPGGARVMSVRTTGEAAYELTHPEGSFSDRTSPELRARVGAEVWAEQPPRVFAARDARLLDVDPARGDVLLAVDDRSVRVEWDAAARNWAAEPAPERAAPRPTGEVRVSPNGRMRWVRSEAVLRLVDRDGTVHWQADVSPATTLRGLGPTGRCVVLASPEGLRTTCSDHTAAGVRHLDSVSAVHVNGLLQDGLAYPPTRAERLYAVYEPFAYDDPRPPVFASIDGLLAVLHGGFQAVFLRRESTRSVPALRAFLTELEAHAPTPRVASVARVGLHLLAEGLSSSAADPVVAAELARIREGADAEGPLYGAPIQYDDYRPRGPYTTDPLLERYFRAFKATQALQLTPAERAALAQEPSVVAAWSAWVDVQAPFLMGSRQQRLFGASPLPPWVDQACTEPGEPRLYALAWGPDSEVFERLVAHDHLPPECGVATRQIPSGLDLLAALGDRSARSLLLTTPAGRYPELPERLEAVAARPLAAPGVAGAWLEVVAALARSERVPPDLEPGVWHRRRMETALSTWVDLRHLLVLVTERSAAQAGAGGEGWFESLEVEPAPGAVDPVPEAWAALAGAARALVALVDAEGEPELRVLLVELAELAEALGAMARAQAAGSPLSADQYDRLDWYVRAVEWPLMELSRYADVPGRRTQLAQPPPDPRIVDVHSVSPPGEARRYLHAAKGRPREVVVLLRDRGVTVPARGAVASYYEVVDTDLLDDAQWLTRLDTTPRPPWVNPPSAEE